MSDAPAPEEITREYLDELMSFAVERGQPFPPIVKPYMDQQQAKLDAALARVAELGGALLAATELMLNAEDALRDEQKSHTQTIKEMGQEIADRC